MIKRLIGLKFPFELDLVQNSAKPIFGVKPPLIPVSESSCETCQVWKRHHTRPSRHNMAWWCIQTNSVLVILIFHILRQYLPSLAGDIKMFTTNVIPSSLSWVICVFVLKHRLLYRMLSLWEKACTKNKETIGCWPPDLLLSVFFRRL